MPIDLYYSPASAPCRIVLLAAEAIGVELNLKTMDFNNQEHLSPAFLKINPQHTVPTIVDNGFALWESRAIITYLQNQYGKDDSLYPKDAKKRALVDQRLYFDISTLYQSIAEHYYPTVVLGAAPDPEKIEKVDKALKLLEGFLEKSEYAAGNNLTLADLSIVMTVSLFETFGHDLSPYKNITRWYSKLKKTLPGFEESNKKAIEISKERIASLTKK